MIGLLLAVFVSALYAVSPITSTGRAAQAGSIGTWTLSGFGSSSVRSVAVDPVYPHIVYAQVDDKAVFKSTDSGATWNTGSAAGLPRSGLSSGDTLTIHPLDTSILYVGSERNGVYKSTDGGITWFKSSTGIRAATTIRKLIISHSDPNILYAAGGYFSGSATIENTYLSADGGASWHAIGTDGLTAGSVVNGLAVNPVDPTVVYLALEGPHQTTGGVFKSVDSGESWSRIDAGQAHRYDEVLIEPGNPDVIYIVYHRLGEAFVYFIDKSSDGGAKWSAVRNVGFGRLNKLIIDPSDPSNIYAAGEFGIDKTRDGGVTWESERAVRGVFTLAIDSSGEHLYAGTSQGVFSYHYTSPKPGPVPVPGPPPSPTPVLFGPNELMSINRSGNDTGLGESRLPVMTPDGRYIAFTSTARDLTSDSVVSQNIYLRDIQTRTTELVSVNMAGTGSANDFSYSPTISDDGRYVAFVSNATNLVANDTTRDTDIFVRDRQKGTTELISVNKTGTASGNGQSNFSAISSDGRYVLFMSHATDLVPETDATGIFGADAFVRDRQTGTTRLVSINSAGTASGNGHTLLAKITPDGRYVAFLSYADDLVADVSDVNKDLDLFVRDMQTGTTTPVSVNSAGTGTGNVGSGFGLTITPDGRYVAFGSSASDLVTTPLDVNGKGDIYLRDLQEKKTSLVSINLDGTNGGNGVSFEPGITPDGRYIIFQSYAGDLVGNDGGNGEDVFVRDLKTGTTELVSVNLAGVATGSETSTGITSSRPSARITPDGRYVAFVSAGGDLTVKSDTDGTNDIFIRDLLNDLTTLVTVSNDTEASGNGDSELRQISADGRYVLFSSYSDNLVAHDTNGQADVFRYDDGRSGTLHFNTLTYYQNENDGQAVITVVREGGTSGAVSATVSTSGGTASAGADYTAINQVVTFADGTSGVKTVTIPITDDALIEGNETVNVTLGSPAVGTVLGRPTSAVLTIFDNDTCSYSITPSSRAALPAGERFTVSVTAQSGCAWAAASNSNFINLTSEASGTGDGTVTLVVLSNGTGAPRIGTVTIAGRTLTVTQSELIPDVLTLGFTQSGFEFDEGVGRATLTITRTGEVSGAASADYRTSDTDAFTIGCADGANNGNGAFGRCDFATTVGRIDFAPGERQKTLTIPLIDDGHDENSETFQVVLSNLTGASSASPNLTATVTVHDNDAPNAPNPIFTTPFFVRQHYLDFLSREPEAGEPWSGVLNRCPNVNNDASCDRLLVSQSFFGSPEFQLKGFYVFRFYKLAFNRLPEYTEIVSDMSFVAGATEAEVYARKAQLSRLFAERPEFQNTYGNLSNGAFVSTLLDRYQINGISTPDPAQPDGTAKVAFARQTLINRLDAGTLTRAQVLRAVADSDEASAREFDNAFVAMQYYGYLRRKPEAAGYEAWLGVLRRGDTRTMVDGFMNSAEYKLRFGRL